MRQAAASAIAGVDPARHDAGEVQLSRRGAALEPVILDRTLQVLVAPLAEALPVVRVPELDHVTLVRLDMIKDRGRVHCAIGLAADTQGFP